MDSGALNQKIAELSWLRVEREHAGKKWSAADQKKVKELVRSMAPPPTDAEIKKWNRGQEMDVIEAYERRTGLRRGSWILQTGWGDARGERLKKNFRPVSKLPRTVFLVEVLSDGAWVPVNDHAGTFVLAYDGHHGGRGSVERSTALSRDDADRFIRSLLPAAQTFGKSQRDFRVRKITL